MMIMTVIWSFLAFDFVYVLTQGGPAYSSEVLSTLSYRYAFYNYTMGPAAAVALVISFFGLIATVFYVRHPAGRGRLMNQTRSREPSRSPMSLLAIGAAIALFPLALMVVSALKTSAEIVANPLALPRAPAVGQFLARLDGRAAWAGRS